MIAGCKKFATFMHQQPLFKFYSTGIACKAAISSDNPMAGNYYGNRIVTYSAPYGLCRHPFSAHPSCSFCGKFAIGCYLPVRNFAEKLPHHLLEFAAARCQWKLSRRRLITVKISVKP